MADEIAWPEGTPPHITVPIGYCTCGCGRPKAEADAAEQERQQSQQPAAGPESAR